MKNYLALLILSLFALRASAQTDLAKELKVLKGQLQEQVQRNDYLKDALSLREGGQELTVDDITIKLTRVYMKEGKVCVEGLVKYIGDGDQVIQFSDQDLVDPKGNLYISYNAGPLNEPTGTLHIAHAVKDINYGFIVIFDNIKEKTPDISLLNLRLSGRGASGIPFNFKGVGVKW
ncbi:hypothetical protein [Sphingobacterium kitahiroshimense]|uniref:DUF4251 domain-containing protein n=1 Tax=Sphingobacterium kitahiroshimense TaxID=470446 RepID=A0ABV0BNZ7_9SPHI